MQSLVRAGAALACLSALAVATDRPQRRVAIGTSTTLARTAASASETPRAPCPRGTLPDANVCIPVPSGPRL